MSSFNFAVSGSLEPYLPLPPVERGPLVVSAVAKVKRLDDNEEGKAPLANSGTANSLRKSRIEIYAETNTPRVIQRHRAWKAEDLMTSPVNTLYATDPIRKAWDLQKRNGFRHIPIITPAGILVGMISDRDLLSAAQGNQIDQNAAVETLMTKAVLTCFPESSLRMAAAIMLRENFSALPVITRDCHVKGILTTSDILRALVNETPLDLWA